MKIHIRKKNKSVAYIKLTNIRYTGHLEIEYLYVDSEHRGNGYATKLIEKAKLKSNVLVGLIEPQSDSSLTYEQEKTWLERKGFKEVKRYDFGNCIKKVMMFRKALLH